MGMADVETEAPGDAPAARPAGQHSRARDVHVSEIMSSDLPYLDPDMPAAAACEVLLRLGLPVAPVVDGERRPVGLVCFEELARLCAAEDRDTDDEHAAARLYARARGGAAGFSVRYALDAGFHLDAPPRACVADAMEPAPLRLFEDSSVACAFGLMRWEHLSHALVTDAGDRVVGIVGQADLARWLGVEGARGHAGPQLPVASHGRHHRRFPFQKAQRTSILVVEDDTEIRAALVSLLQDEGFVTVQAANGEEALQVLASASAQPGLILLDLVMPKMNGWQFRAEQLRREQLRSIPVVVLSAQGPSLAERSQIGAAEVLRKPVTADMLLDVVELHFQRFN